MTWESDWHVPVMVSEVLEYLEPERGGLFFDGTVGGGGHADAILRRGEGARVLGVDRDAEAVEGARARLSEFGPRVRLVCEDHAAAAESLREPLAGALLDLGVSSHQIDETERGFSFRVGAPLDMRMSRLAGVRTAADLLNELSERELADVFYRYGEERRSRRLASEVVRRRAVKPFRTADDLVAALHGGLGSRPTVRTKARLFQALRMAVNEETEQLERVLVALRDRLSDGGVLVVLSYHSLEDRRVKESFREWSRGCVCPPDFPVCVCGRVPLGRELTRKVRVPTREEQERNPRSRSAKLRAWRRVVAEAT